MPRKHRVGLIRVLGRSSLQESVRVLPMAMVLALALVLIFGIACATPERASQTPTQSTTPDRPTQAPSTRENPLVTSLLMVAGTSVEAGELDEAEQRYRRVLEIDPHSSPAKLGLARIARLRGNEAIEQDWLGEVLEHEPQSLESLRRLAELAVRANRPERALEFVDQALEIDPFDFNLLAMQLDLTGPAPSPEGLTPERVLELSRLHPFDLPVALRAAEVQLDAGNIPAARRLLFSAYWLADLDPKAGRKIRRLLSKIDTGFAARKIVPVHIYADQTVTRQPGWKMRMRILWRKTSAALDPLIRTFFVPVSISEFDTTRVGSDLRSLELAWRASRDVWPRRGVLVAFTERSLGRRQGQMLGRAVLLGRRTIVRLNADATESRTLIHEVFHLYGGVHVSDVVDSLMNPSGNTTSLDPLNAEIIKLTRNRRFRHGGEVKNVNPYVDTDRLLAFYIRALQINLMFRNEELARASELSTSSRSAANKLAQGATRLDDHLAQVAAHASEMLLRDRHYAKAAGYNDLAATLYGEQSPKGREQTRRGDRLRALAETIYSEQSPSLEPNPHPTETE